jgi:hypothetical protein
MFIQNCIKGVWGPSPSGNAGIDDAKAEAIVLGGEGILCNWWRNVGRITTIETRSKLTADNLDRHVHDYEVYASETPFISLTAGCVERDVALRINRIHEAEDVATRFATEFGRRDGYLFYCWVVTGLKPAVGIQGVAEEIRELNTYLSWSDYQLEGEVTAKIWIPSNQIEAWERWKSDGNGTVTRKLWRRPNPGFVERDAVSNIRPLLKPPR